MAEHNGTLLESPPMWSTTAIRKICLAAGLVSLAVALISRIYFTSGAQEFEGLGPRGEPRERYLGQRSSIPVYGPHGLWVFKANVLGGVGRIRLMTVPDQAVELDVTKADRVYLPMFTSGRLWPRRYEIGFQTGYDAWVRQLSGQIVYPPILMSVPLLMTSGASEAVPAGAGMSLVCDEDCLLAVLHDERRATSLRLELTSLSPAATRLSRSVEAATFARIADSLPVSLGPIPEWALVKKSVHAATGESETIALDIPAVSGWYRLRIAGTQPAGSPPGPAMKVVLTESPPAI